MNAALSRTSPVSSEIGLIRETIAENTNEHGLYLTQDRSRILLRRLEIINQAITNLEHEVAVHRIGENNRGACGVLDDLLGEFLTEEASNIDAPTGNLVFPEFGASREH